MKTTKKTKRTTTNKRVSKSKSKKTTSKVKSKTVPRHTPASRRKSVAPKALTVKLPCVMVMPQEGAVAAEELVADAFFAASSYKDGVEFVRCGDATLSSTENGDEFYEHVVLCRFGHSQDANVLKLVEKFAPKDEPVADEHSVWEAVAELRRGMHALEAAVGQQQ